MKKEFNTSIHLYLPKKIRKQIENFFSISRNLIYKNLEFRKFLNLFRKIQNFKDSTENI